MSIPSSGTRPPLVTTTDGAAVTDTEPADVLTIFGKGIPDADIQQIIPIVKKEGLHSLLLGDGVRNVRSKPLQQAMHDKLAQDGQVVVIGHATDNEAQHNLALSEFSGGYGHIPTRNLIRWAHGLQSSEVENTAPQKKQRTGKRFVHIAACHTEHVTGQIKPGSPEWKAGYTLIYSDTGEVSLHQYASSLKVALAYVEFCKDDDKPVNPLKLFLLASKRQGNSLTLLGGKLNAPLVSRRPRTMEDLGEEQSRSRVTGNAADLERLLAAEKKLTLAEKFLLPEPTQQLMSIAFDCIDRDEQLALEALLQQHPKLIDARGPSGMNVLMQACAWNKTGCVKLLIRLGAQVNQTCDDGDSALHVAVENRNRELVSLLLEAGASSKIINEKGQNCLQMALALGMQDIATLIENHHTKQMKEQTKG
jgi:hypothetical protein